ncbi:phosphatidylcholine transfer protein isoform X1 [Hemibagrus wyckioides]|uniref:phosphatidylcholine transfer protein isoform X1 n=1 Tax=Hemibagrus wyckioides TaxID=337641 RepID=UPI00266B54C7|nr:phosphatidylcholine transfer protein isoform X1 [Hemibagrus wyckioides]
MCRQFENMALQFTDADFQAAWTELDEPQIEGGWELFTESMGVKIYRLYNKETGLYEYKVFGTLSGCCPEVCADVYMDLDYRKQWDSYVKGNVRAELHEKDYGGQKAVYWEVKYPFPLSNRDYVYIRERRDLQVNGRKIWTVLARSSVVSNCPEKSGVIRVKDYKQTVAMESDGAQGTKVFMNYFDNPGGNIPTWLINWAAKAAFLGGGPCFQQDQCVLQVPGKQREIPGCVSVPESSR